MQCACRHTGPTYLVGESADEEESIRLEEDEVVGSEDDDEDRLERSEDDVDEDVFESMVEELSREKLEEEEVFADVLVGDDVVREVDERDEVLLLEESVRSDSDELDREEVLELRDDVDLVPEDELVPESARSASRHKGTHVPMNRCAQKRPPVGATNKGRPRPRPARGHAAPEIRRITWRAHPIDGVRSMQNRAIGVCTNTA